MRAANVKRYDRRKLQALRILHEELENVRARASLHGRGFALSHTLPPQTCTDRQEGLDSAQGEEEDQGRDHAHDGAHESP